MKINIDELANNSKLVKNVAGLKEPTKRAKQTLINLLEKNIKRLQDQAEKSTSEEKMSQYLKKKERLSKDLTTLKVLSDEDIIKYSLLMSNKIMSKASNLRVPREERMKARVAAHKPLSTHLRKLSQKLSVSQETESESESKNEEDSSNPTLNKITFNNKIVAMRKDVKRAKVHVIHKITRNITKLRAAKGEEEKVGKYQRKAERLHKKVIQIKELHEDEISKFALSTTQNVNQLAFDVKVSTLSQALATVAINKFVAAHVNSFRSKYPDWQKIVPNLLKNKRKKRKLNLGSKDSQKGSSEFSKENHESDQESSGSENEFSGTDNGSENDVEEESEAESNKNLTDKSDEDVCDSDEEASSASDNNVTKVVKVKSKNSKMPEKLTDSSILKSKTCKSKIVMKSKESKNETHLESASVESKQVENKPKVIDPFFITTTNKEYETSQVPLLSGNATSNKTTEHFDRDKPGKFINLVSKSKWERTKSERKYGNFSKFQSFAPYTKTNPSTFNKFSESPKTDKLVFGNRKERRKAIHQPPVEEKVEKLHPSWEAKKKQSVFIPFQGKKVTFD